MYLDLPITDFSEWQFKTRKEKLMEISKLGGWGQLRTNLPLFFFFEKKHKLQAPELPKTPLKQI